MVSKWLLLKALMHKLPWMFGVSEQFYPLLNQKGLYHLPSRKHWCAHIAICCIRLDFNNAHERLKHTKGVGLKEWRRIL